MRWAWDLVLGCCPGHIGGWCGPWGHVLLGNPMPHTAVTPT